MALIQARQDSVADWRTKERQVCPVNLVNEQLDADELLHPSSVPGACFGGRC